MTTLLTLSIVCNAVLLVLWLLARNDKKHERAASVEISRQLGELLEWKRSAMSILLKYDSAAELLPLEIGDRKSEALYQFVASHVPGQGERALRYRDEKLDPLDCDVIGD